MLWDTHMHTCYSGDSEASPAAMLNAAISKNLDGVCFTDHLDIDYPKDPSLFLLDLPEYTSAILSLKETYCGRISVRLGLELGVQPHLAAAHADILARYPFDFVIASSHVVHGIDPYYPEYYEGRTQEEGYREYFESILENILAFDSFDVYGHLDYVVRYGPTKNTGYHWTKYQDVIDEILKLLIKKEKGIEINTAGFKYGLSHPNPTEEIIARYRTLGGEIITIGSDAHKPEHVAYDFCRVSEILRASGFSYYTVYEKRKPLFLKLPAA